MTSQPVSGVGRFAAGLVAATALLLLTGCMGSDDGMGPLTSDITVSDDDGMNGAVLTDKYDVPKVSLTATDGSSYSLRADTAKPLTLVFFGYTNCPDICQVVMADIASAMTRLDGSQREQVDMLFVTTDPARDDEKTLRTYLDRFDPSFEGLTGDLGTIVNTGKAFGVPIEKGAKMPSGGYEVTHGTQIVAIDADDRSPIVWTEGTSGEALAEDIVKLLETGTLTP